MYGSGVADPVRRTPGPVIIVPAGAMVELLIGIIFYGRALVWSLRLCECPDDVDVCGIENWTSGGGSSRTNAAHEYVASGLRATTPPGAPASPSCRRSGTAYGWPRRSPPSNDGRPRSAARTNGPGSPRRPPVGLSGRPVGTRADLHNGAAAPLRRRRPPAISSAGGSLRRNVGGSPYRTYVRSAWCCGRTPGRSAWPVSVRGSDGAGRLRSRSTAIV